VVQISGSTSVYLALLSQGEVVTVAPRVGPSMASSTHGLQSGPKPATIRDATCSGEAQWGKEGLSDKKRWEAANFQSVSTVDLGDTAAAGKLSHDSLPSEWNIGQADSMTLEMLPENYQEDEEDEVPTSNPLVSSADAMKQVTSALRTVGTLQASQSDIAPATAEDNTGGAAAQSTMPVYGMAVAAACGITLEAAPQHRRMPALRLESGGDGEAALNSGDNPKRSRFGDGQDEVVAESDMAVSPEEDLEFREATEGLHPPPSSARGQLFNKTYVCKRTTPQVLEAFSWLPIVGPTEAVDSPDGRLANYMRKHRGSDALSGADVSLTDAAGEEQGCFGDTFGERKQMGASAPNVNWHSESGLPQDDDISGWPRDDLVLSVADFSASVPASNP